jgi:hypothetical protein
MARYQLRLNLRKGRIAWATKLPGSGSFIRIPLQNASGSHKSEQILFQKLSRTLSRLTKASSLSNHPGCGGVRRPCATGSR